MSIKCPKKHPLCELSLILALPKNKKNFICSGTNLKPGKYPKDNIWLCMHSKKTNFDIQMTVEEAFNVCSVLLTSLSFLAPSILKEEIKKLKNKKCINKL